MNENQATPLNAAGNSVGFTLAHPYFHAPFKHEHGMIVDKDYHRMLDVRGWGHLTGSGAHSLSDDKAMPIQDQIGDSVAQLLNENWKEPRLPALIAAVDKALAAWDGWRGANNSGSCNLVTLAEALSALRALREQMK